MQALVRAGMRDGAFGLSTGLFYVPGIFTPTDEVVALAAVAGELGGIHVSHMRNEAAAMLESVKETIAIGEQGRLPTQITHHKIIGKRNWGRSIETLALVARARARGVDVTIDQYPYTASSTGISALLPPWALEGQQADIVARLRDAAQRAKIKCRHRRCPPAMTGAAAIRRTCRSRPAPGMRRWRAGTSPRSRGREARNRRVENAAETTMWIVEQGGAQGIFHAIDEADLERILQDPATMIASDGEVPVFGQASPHPRSYGTFVRVLGRYVRERRVLTLPDAVRKMTSFPAQRAGLEDRGLLRPGMKADIAVWDAGRIADRATYEQPHQYAVGVDTVIVNGQVVFEHGAMTPARPGRVLRGPAWKPER